MASTKLAIITAGDGGMVADGVRHLGSEGHDKKIAFVIKWLASVIQILGYSATAFGLTPWNIYLFLVGLAGWLIVGFLWSDRAIILIHLVALCAMFVGLAS
jgi:hypothetical protein